VRPFPPLLRYLCTAALPFVAGAALAAQADTEKPYLAEIQTAMDTMMAGMMAPPSGDVDRDFVAMMRPHHQGAIDMAVAELKYGRNEQLRRIAQEIIVDQQQEIAAMNLAVGAPLPPSAPAPTQGGTPSAATMPGMAMPAAHQDHGHHMEQ
jgi:hypothetical protein